MVNAVKVFTLRLCISAYYIHFKRVKVKIFTAFTIKGTQLLHALEQIDSTIVRFRSILKDYDLFPRIVYHGNTHDIHGNAYRKFKTKYPTTRAETDYMEEVLK